MSKLSIAAGLTAALLAMSPVAALAQENTANTDYAVDPAANTTEVDPLTANETSADPLATETEVITTTDPMAEEPVMDTADDGRRGKAFPWGLLGLLGLAGLLGSRRSQ